jgi:hypothetical protein
MSTQVHQALEAIRSVKPAGGGAGAELSPLKNNAHIHLPPNFSAFETVDQAVKMTAGEGVAVLGVSNYYDYNVYGTFASLARAAHVFPLFGLEIICLLDDLKSSGVKLNDPGNPGKMYICGKAITRFAPPLFTKEGERLLNTIRHSDSTRMDKMVTAMERVFSERGMATGTTTASVIDMVVRRHGSPCETVYLQERHVAQAFEQATHAIEPAQRLERLGKVLGTPSKAKGPDDAVGIQNDLRSHLMKAGKPAYVDETFVSFPEAFALIRELGGYACYPLLLDGASPISAFEASPDGLIAHLRQRNIHAAEFIPARNDVKGLTEYATKLRAAGFVVTAGTEHNTQSLIPIEPSCLNNVPIPDAVKAIFWEGACVAAAHQYLTLNGKTGYTDSGGNPNPDYGSADERIRSLAKLGQGVINAYRGGH